jgi:hypothetical protein
VKAEMNLAPCTMRHRSSAQLRAILEPKQINFARDYDLIATIRTVVFLLAGKLDFIQLNPHARRMHVNPLEIQRHQKNLSIEYKQLTSPM